MQCNPTRFLIGPRVPRPFLSYFLLMLRDLEAPKLMDITERSFFSMEKIKQNTILPCLAVLFHICQVIPGPLDSRTKSSSPNTALLLPRAQAGGTFSKYPLS